MHFDYTLLAEWPPLAWLARCAKATARIAVFIFPWAVERAKERYACRTSF